jgi:hypothetical protein
MLQRRERQEPATTGCEQVQQYACRAARKQTQQNRRIGEYDGLADEGLAE